eukprot:TRINITY_DN66683_c10_g1_i1.p1 TRINITY_DN66683_c10_g1~~TRINITY_DN66683_c10_g1_i1.p1  ORF type:complete len:152 (-),score=10.36 TRINITY_DN66683_c10_g1_i1:88-543(-)
MLGTHGHGPPELLHCCFTVMLSLLFPFVRWFAWRMVRFKHKLGTNLANFISTNNTDFRELFCIATLSLCKCNSSSQHNSSQPNSDASAYQTKPPHFEQSLLRERLSSNQLVCELAGSVFAFCLQAFYLCESKVLKKSDGCSGGDYWVGGMG